MSPPIGDAQAAGANGDGGALPVTGGLGPLDVAVVGLGKIGLPLAVAYALAGHRVHGADVDAALVASVNAGIEPFPGEQDLARHLVEVVSSGRLTAMTDTAMAVARSGVVIVVVPVVIDAAGSPEFASMDAAVRDIASGLQPGALVVFETTVPVGTTRGRFAPALAAGSGLALGTEIQVAYSPERVLTGRVFADLRRYPKLVGGLDERSAARAVAVYEALLAFEPRPDLARPNGVWDLGSAEAAELAKLAETTYRDVNIALANQFARYAERSGIDIHAVIEACNSQPYSHIHAPGVAVGGHCIPVYPHLYLNTDPTADLVRTARATNAAMPEAACTRLESAMDGTLAGRRIVVLGAAYRGGVKETAFSGVFPLVDALRRRGAVPVVHDPLYDDAELRRLGLTPFHRGDPADAVIVHTAHPEYLGWGPSDVVGVRCILDGRAWTQPGSWPGVTHLTIGRA